VLLCPKILEDIVHHHLLGGGVKFLEMQFKEEGSKDRFPEEQGLGKFNLTKSIDFSGKLMAMFNLVWYFWMVFKKNT
jgi:hypothetical protein